MSDLTWDDVRAALRHQELMGDKPTDAQVAAVCLMSEAGAPDDSDEALIESAFELITTLETQGVDPRQWLEPDWSSAG
jgi:hypothetical protein